MTSLYLLFSKAILRYNLAFTFLFSLLLWPLYLKEDIVRSVTSGLTSDYFDYTVSAIGMAMIRAFMWSFLTGGFIIAMFYYESRHKNEYYFYHNLGLTKSRLIIISYLSHLGLSLPVLFILYYVSLA